MLKRRIIACAYCWFPAISWQGGVACSQICMINSPVPGEHLEDNQGIQRHFQQKNCAGVGIAVFSLTFSIADVDYRIRSTGFFWLDIVAVVRYGCGWLICCLFVCFFLFFFLLSG